MDQCAVFIILLVGFQRKIAGRYVSSKWSLKLTSTIYMGLFNILWSLTELYFSALQDRLFEVKTCMS